MCKVFHTCGHSQINYFCAETECQGHLEDGLCPGHYQKRPCQVRDLQDLADFLQRRHDSIREEELCIAHKVSQIKRMLPNVPQSPCSEPLPPALLVALRLLTSDLRNSARNMASNNVNRRLSKKPSNKSKRRSSKPMPCLTQAKQLISNIEQKLETMYGTLSEIKLLISLEKTSASADSSDTDFWEAHLMREPESLKGLTQEVPTSRSPERLSVTFNPSRRLSPPRSIHGTVLAKQPRTIAEAVRAMEAPELAAYRADAWAQEDAHFPEGPSHEEWSDILGHAWAWSQMDSHYNYEYADGVEVGPWCVIAGDKVVLEQTKDYGPEYKSRAQREYDKRQYFCGFTSKNVTSSETESGGARNKRW